MKRLRRNSEDPSKPSDPGIPSLYSRDLDRKCGNSSMRLMGVFVVCLMVISVVFSVCVVLRDPPSDGVWAFAEARVLEDNPKTGTS